MGRNTQKKRGSKNSQPSGVAAKPVEPASSEEIRATTRSSKLKPIPGTSNGESVQVAASGSSVEPTTTSAPVTRSNRKKGKSKDGPVSRQASSDPPKPGRTNSVGKKINGESGESGTPPAADEKELHSVVLKGRRNKMKDGSSTSGPTPLLTPAAAEESSQTSEVGLRDIMNLVQELRNEVAEVKAELQAVKESARNCFDQTVKPEISETKALATKANNKVFYEARSCSLMVIGVPGYISENSNPSLSQVFKKMCELLGYKDKKQPDVRMSWPKLKKNDPHKPILQIDFLFKRDKIDFYSRYMRNRKDMLAESLGLSPNLDRIFINEYLTSANNQIRKRALELREQEKLKHVVVRNGRVYVVTEGEEKPKLIEELEKLEQY